MPEVSSTQESQADAANPRDAHGWRFRILGDRPSPPVGRVVAVIALARGTLVQNNRRFFTALATISLAASMIVEFSSANQRSFGLD
jgi:hypothetical protein